MNEYLTTIPADIRSRVEATAWGDYRRTDQEATQAQAAMLRLGVRADSEFYSFVTSYCLGNLSCSEEAEELRDVAQPTEEIDLCTTFVREVWGLPEQYICLSSCQGEGCYLLSKSSGEVFDFSLAGREVFIAEPVARWESFFEFLRWYLPS